MRYITILLLFIYGCSHQAFEIAQMVENVLDEDQGVIIQITPEEKQKKSK